MGKGTRRGPNGACPVTATAPGRTQRRRAQQGAGSGDHGREGRGRGRAEPAEAGDPGPGPLREQAAACTRTTLAARQLTRPVGCPATSFPPDHGDGASAPWAPRTWAPRRHSREHPPRLRPHCPSGSQAGRSWPWLRAWMALPSRSGSHATPEVGGVRTGGLGPAGSVFVPLRPWTSVLPETGRAPGGLAELPLGLQAAPHPARAQRPAPPWTSARLPYEPSTEGRCFPRLRPHAPCLPTSAADLTSRRPSRPDAHAYEDHVSNWALSTGGASCTLSFFLSFFFF